MNRAQFGAFILFALSLVGVLSDAFAETVIPSLKAKNSDPFDACAAIQKQLPKSLPALRKIDTLISESLLSCNDYAGDPPKQCRVHKLDFKNLELTVMRFKDRAIPIELTASGKYLTALTALNKGTRSLSTLEFRYGVNIPKSASPIEVMGECTPLVVWHSNGNITKLALNCHACD